MKIAVLTMTRDRLPYTKHCVRTLQENAGYAYDHYILDQASADGTDEWLDSEYEAGRVIAYSILGENIGVCRGLNQMLEEELNADDYDVIVRFDNDCEVLQPDTLRNVCETTLRFGAIVAPHVQGLRNPPQSIGKIHLDLGPVADGERGAYTLSQVHHLGGIFMAIPAVCFTDHGYRYDESQPLWAGDELICPWWAARGGVVGYLEGWEVNHYLTTDGQAEDIPDYFQRRVLEGGPAR